MIVNRVIERIPPLALKVWEKIVSAVTFCFGGALSLVGAGFLILAGYLLSLTDAALLLQNGGQPPSDTRDGLVILSAAALGGLIWGLHILHDWFRPHGENARATARVAELESQLVEVGQFADEAAQCAAEAEWARDALAAIAEVFKIDGVLEAARRSARKALHPDAHPGAGDDELREMTERFQMAEAVFDRLAN